VRVLAVNRLLLNKISLSLVPNLFLFLRFLLLSFSSSSVVKKNRLLSFVLSCSNQGTTTTPILPACATTLLATPSKLSPPSLSSPCLILAISNTCFKLTVPTTPNPPLPAVNCPPDALPTPANPALELGPATLPAPRNLFFLGSTPAALRSKDAVGGVRSSKVKLRSGRTVPRAGMGVPGT
jgi:hypothetical protein